ncbi:MAG: hypothetical protein GY875_13335 [Gammaproteobacteria bacterium]|nr:hypothetical protein [Gammaproteobacteria bacterium]
MITENSKATSGPGLLNLRLALTVLLMLCGLYAGDSTALEIGPDFDHDDTRYPLDFQHAQVLCEGCHVQGVFIGTPTQCARCHSLSGRIKASAPTSKHIRVIGECEVCHTPTVWTDVFRVDHVAVIGSCQGCHNNVVAEGKHPGHVVSSNICEDCHNTFTWVGARYNHAGITGNCIRCHNGGIAEGKDPGHILSAPTCEDCHSTSSWIPAFVDHTSVIGTCFSCHNGTVAEGKDPDHCPSSNACELCHSTQDWTPASPCP